MIHAFRYWMPIGFIIIDSINILEWRRSLSSMIPAHHTSPCSIYELQNVSRPFLPCKYYSPHIHCDNQSILFLGRKVQFIELAMDVALCTRAVDASATHPIVAELQCTLLRISVDIHEILIISDAHKYTCGTSKKKIKKQSFRSLVIYWKYFYIVLMDWRNGREGDRRMENSCLDLYMRRY